jgi:hypothetical protein
MPVLHPVCQPRHDVTSLVGMVFLDQIKPRRHVAGYRLDDWWLVEIEDGAAGPIYPPAVCKSGTSIGLPGAHVICSTARLASSHLAAAKAFYGDALGMSVVMDLGWIMTFAADGSVGAADQRGD